MRTARYVIAITCCALTLNAQAGYELVCKGESARSNHKLINVDCSNRKSFIDMLGAAWMELRRNNIGGGLENMCWEAYNQAKGLHPSISFEGISDSFLIRCNMGLKYVN